MNISENREAQIDRYLFDQMAGEELSSFEKEIASDAELKAQVEQIRREHRAMQLMLNEDLSANINQWKNEGDSTSENTESKTGKVVKMGRRRSFVRQLAVAASILLAVGVGTRFWAGSNYNDQALAGKHFPSISNDARDIRSGDATEVEAAVSLIEKGNYQEALSKLRALPNSDSDTQILPLIGESEFHLENYDAAVDAFEKVVQNTTSSTKKAAEMKLLHAYLAAGKKADFENLKSEILASGEPKRVDAVKSLESDLNSFWRIFSGK